MVKPLELTELKRIAEERNGQCLSQEYKNSAIPLEWKCSKNHVWFASASNVKHNKSWCPVCANIIKKTIPELKELATRHGGELLSSEYTPGNKLIWKCADGHEWEARMADIANGSWCPRCNTRLKEGLCRIFFEHIFQNKFPKCRPKWLLSDLKAPLELDGYCEKIKIAFEYQGEQHYFKLNHIPIYSFQRTQLNDSIKRRTCAEMGITLLEIPYTIDEKQLCEYILKKCEEKKLEVKTASIIDGGIPFHSKLKEIKELAALRGGKCLSDKYMGGNKKHKFSCKKGHIFETPASAFKFGRWCKKCANIEIGIKNRAYRTKITIPSLKQLAKSRGGDILSTHYSPESKLLWICEKQHVWKTNAYAVKSGSWCPTCVTDSQKRTIENMRDFAKNRNGRCLSEKYVNIKHKLEWECAKGHRWFSAPYNIRSGKWCRRCGKTSAWEKRRNAEISIQ